MQFLFGLFFSFFFVTKWMFLRSDFWTKKTYIIVTAGRRKILDRKRCVNLLFRTFFISLFWIITIWIVIKIKWTKTKIIIFHFMKWNSSLLMYGCIKNEQAYVIWNNSLEVPLLVYPIFYGFILTELLWKRKDNYIPGEQRGWTCGWFRVHKICPMKEPECTVTWTQEGPIWLWPQMVPVVEASN